MKEPWREAFQDRLGDYEMDMPVPEAVPVTPARRKLVLPLVLSTAAAALALLLLLPSGKQHSGGNRHPLGMPKERPVALLAENVPHPGQAFSTQSPSRRQPLSRQRFPQTQLTDSQDNTEESQIIPDATDVQAGAPASSPDVAAAGTDKPEDDIGSPAENPLAWEEEPAQQTRRQGRFYTQVHAGSLLSGSAPSGSGWLNHYYYASGVQQADFGGLYPLASSSNQITYYNTEAATGANRTKNWNCALPIRAGLSLRYQATPVFGVESGLEYSYHYAREADYPQSECRLHYLGIPVKASVRMARWERLQLYTTLGAEAEWPVAGQFVSHAGKNKVTTHIGEHPAQYALMGAMGIDFRIASRLSLYAEPGLGWHFGMTDNLPSYYREHPLSFDLRAGLRFNLL